MTLISLLLLIILGTSAIIYALTASNNSFLFALACFLLIVPVVCWAIILILLYGGPIYL